MDVNGGSVNTVAYQIRRQEPEDGVALHEVYSQPRVVWGVLLCTRWRAFARATLRISDNQGEGQ